MAINDISSVGIGYAYQPTTQYVAVNSSYAAAGVTATTSVESGVDTVSSATNASTNVVTQTQNLISSLITYDGNGRIINSSRNVTGTLVNIIG